MSKKIGWLAVLWVAICIGAAISQAALIELQVGGAPLIDVLPGAGSLLIDVVLTDTESLAFIDGFNLWIGVSGTGATSLTADPAGDTLPGYIFPTTFAYFVTQTSPLEIAVAGSTFDTGITGLLAQLNFDFAGNLGDIYSFGLVDASQNFVSMGADNEFPLVLTGNTNIWPIPGTIWLFGSSLLGLIGIGRMKT